MRLSGLLTDKRALAEAVVALAKRLVEVEGRLTAMAAKPGQGTAEAVTRVERGSALGRGPADPGLSVLSWNLLAPLYVRPIDKRTGEIQDFVRILPPHTHTTTTTTTTSTNT